MPAFHDLEVAGLEPLTDDSRLLTLSVPDELRDAYRFFAGQHLTFRVRVDGTEQRRTYSISSAPASGVLQVGVKLLPDGVFSRLVHGGLRVGDRLSVMTPAGRFGRRGEPVDGRRYAAVVAGSGITPVLSIMADALSTEPHSEFVLIYGNRSSGSVMFADQLGDLNDVYGPRMTVYHVLSQEDSGSALLTGRIDSEKLERFLELHPPAEVDEWYLCGPSGLVQLASDALRNRGVLRGRVHRELFFTGEPVDVPPAGGRLEPEAIGRSRSAAAR